MVAGEVESSCQLVVTFFFFFFFLVSPYQTIEISLGQPSPPSYQLLPPPLGRALVHYHKFLFIKMHITEKDRYTLIEQSDNNQTADCSIRVYRSFL